MTESSPPPKLFISYSWTSPEHKRWVLELYNTLRTNGVNPIIDARNIKLGQDSVGFMKKMVADATIRKVLMVVDKTYAEKADAGQGGVGIETQIISQQICKDEEQDKFAALVLEKDENGSPYLPDYYGKRVYIDFSESEDLVEKFDDLLQWIFDARHEKPPIGPRPDFSSNKKNKGKPNITSLLRTDRGRKGNKKYISRQARMRYRTIERTALNGDSWEFYPDNTNKWRWTRSVKNGKIVGNSLEGYLNKRDCIANAKRNGMNFTVETCKGKNDDLWEIYEDNAREWRWRRTATNRNIVGASTEGYVNKSDCIANAHRNGMDCTPTPVAE